MTILQYEKLRTGLTMMNKNNLILANYVIHRIHFWGLSLAFLIVYLS